jgi:hypothetical protein
VVKLRKWSSRSARIDLGKQPAHIEGRELRFRKLTIEPGGIASEGRPALPDASEKLSTG